MFATLSLTLCRYADLRAAAHPPQHPQHPRLEPAADTLTSTGDHSVLASCVYVLRPFVTLLPVP